MSEQPINQWNMTTEPSDMMKINTPMPITVAPSPSNQMEVIDDDSFSYDGYQVVRGEFFAHIYEPSFTFNNYKVSLMVTAPSPSAFGPRASKRTRF